MYCPECGVNHHADDEAAAAAVDRELEIARVQAQRDVDIARINARIQRDELATAETVAETYAEADVATAAAEAELIGAGIAAGIEPEPDPQPIVVTATDDDDQADDLEPPRGDEAGSPVPDPAKPAHRGIGMW